MANEYRHRVPDDIDKEHMRREERIGKRVPLGNKYRNPKPAPEGIEEKFNRRAQQVKGD